MWKMIITGCILFGCNSYNPKIIIKNDHLHRNVIFRDMVRGSFQDIKIIDAIGTNPIPKVAFIGQTGLWILNGSDYKLLKKYRFVTNENKRLWFGTGAKIITDTGASPISPAVSILTPRGKLSLITGIFGK